MVVGLCVVGAAVVVRWVVGAIVDCFCVVLAGATGAVVAALVALGAAVWDVVTAMDWDAMIGSGCEGVASVV